MKVAAALHRRGDLSMGSQCLEVLSLTITQLHNVKRELFVRELLNYKSQSGSFRIWNGGTANYEELGMGLLLNVPPSNALKMACFGSKFNRNLCKNIANGN